MTKSKPSVSFFVVLSIILIHLVRGAQFLNASCVSGAPVTVILALTKI